MPRKQKQHITKGKKNLQMPRDRNNSSLTQVILAPYREPMMNNALSNVTVKQLKRAIKIKAKLETLQARFDQIMGGSGAGMPSPFRKRKMSAAGRAAIAAGARKRWAKQKGDVTVKPTKKGRRKMSAAARARLSASAKARWVKAKAAGKTTL
jgi:hypothetical protein